MPHVQLPQILSDVEDALAWCRTHLPSLLSPDVIDIDAYVAAGDSAGGTLSTLSGIYLDPRPRVVIDVFGVVDMTDPHFFTPFTPEKLALPFVQDLEPRDRAEQARSLADRDESRAEVICPWDWELEPKMSEADLRVFWGKPDFKVEAKHRYRMDLNKVLNRDASRMNLLLQREKYGSDQAFFEDVKKRWSVLHMLDTLETGSKQYTPTFILHGDADNAVPVEQSYKLEEKLRAMGVEVEAVYCPGGEHCFENKIEVSLPTWSACTSAPSGSSVLLNVPPSSQVEDRPRRAAADVDGGQQLTSSGQRMRVGTDTLPRAWPLSRSTLGSEGADRRARIVLLCAAHGQQTADYLD